MAKNNYYNKSMTLRKLSNLAIVATVLLQNSVSVATYNRVAQGVVRIDLTKQYVPHVDIIDLEESETTDLEIRIEESSY